MENLRFLFFIMICPQILCFELGRTRHRYDIYSFNGDTVYIQEGGTTKIICDRVNTRHTVFWTISFPKNRNFASCGPCDNWVVGCLPCNVSDGNIRVKREPGFSEVQILGNNSQYDGALIGCGVRITGKFTTSRIRVVGLPATVPPSNSTRMNSGEDGGVVVWVAGVEGVLLFMVVVIGVSLILWMKRRQWTLPCAGTAHAGIIVNSSRPGSSVRATSLSDDGEYMEVSSHLSHYSGAPSMYNSLYIANMSQPSYYAPIGHRGNSRM